MIRSMTGFGAGRAAEGDEQVDVEIRSVNHKFCEVKARLPRELAALELDVTRTVKERLTRGGVDVSVRRTGSRSSVLPRIDVALAEEYARSFRDLRARLGLAGEVALSDVVGSEGVVRLDERPVDAEASRRAVTGALEQALDAVLVMRGREGEALARDLDARLEIVARLVGQIEQLAPTSIDHYRARLHERVAEVARGVALDPARMAQEVALFADRMDISEELTRMRSHVAQVRTLLAGGEPAGRKMEFVVQEMHREANTIGSKSQSGAISTAVVSLKAEVERMREQVQNVE